MAAADGTQRPPPARRPPPVCINQLSINGRKSLVRSTAKFAGGRPRKPGAQRVPCPETIMTATACEGRAGKTARPVRRNETGDGGRYWDRTSDPYDVNVVLYR